MKLDELARDVADSGDAGRYVALHGGAPMAIADTPDAARAEALRVLPRDADMSTLTVEAIEAQQSGYAGKEGKE